MRADRGSLRPRRRCILSRWWFPVKRILALLTVVLCSFGWALSAGSALAQDYPHRIITLVVSAAAGGPGDNAARLIADRMSTALGQQVVVENVPGAGGVTGTSRVAHAAPDGYTLLVQQTGIAITPFIYSNLNFDVARDLTPVGLVNSSYSFLVGRKDLPPSTMPELVAYMKGPGHPLKFAHPGTGTLGELISVMLAKSVGTDVNLIPYRGGGPAMNDVLGGHVDLVWAASSTSAPLIKAGSVKAYAYGAGKRYASIPDVPSITELGYPELDIRFWHALFAPAATPKPIIDKLNAALRETLADPEVMKRYERTGVEPFPPEQRSVEAANAFFQAELKRWKQVIAENNIKPVP